MRLILLSLLTLVLVGCGEIRLEVGSDDDELGSDDGEVGTYVWMPQPDTLGTLGDVQKRAYLVNTRNGRVQSCLKYVTDDIFLCVYTANPSNARIEDF
jgi:hypothetical protein